MAMDPIERMHKIYRKTNDILGPKKYRWVCFCERVKNSTLWNIKFCKLENKRNEIYVWDTNHLLECVSSVWIWKCSPNVSTRVIRVSPCVRFSLDCIVSFGDDNNREQCGIEKVIVPPWTPCKPCVARAKGWMEFATNYVCTTFGICSCVRFSSLAKSRWISLEIIPYYIPLYNNWRTVLPKRLLLANCIFHKFSNEIYKKADSATVLSLST